MARISEIVSLVGAKGTNLKRISFLINCEPDAKDRQHGMHLLEDYVKNQRIQVCTLIANPFLNVSLLLQKDYELGNIVEIIVPTLKDCNLRVCESGLSTLLHLMNYKSEDPSSLQHIQPLLGPIIQALIDRLGDSKTNVRTKAIELLLAIAKVASPKETFNMLISSKQAFSHKNPKVREAVCSPVSTYFTQQSYVQYSCKQCTHLGLTSFHFASGYPNS